MNTQDWATYLGIDTCCDGEIERMVDSCGRFLLGAKLKERPRWITLLGKSGTGKTHCARKLWDKMTIWLDWRACEFLQVPIYWPAFVSELRSGVAYDRLRDMQKWPVLFLDDICAERDNTGFASEQLNTLLGCRAGKWTIITSNLTLENIGSVDPRIADRMIRDNGIVVEIKTTSYALRKLTKQVAGWRV